MNVQLNDILTAYEAEHYIENLQMFEITELGSKKYDKFLNQMVCLR